MAALVVVVGPASGATTRFFVETFGSAAQPTFPADRGMAVDQATDELYVLDVTEDEIRRYNADGTPSNFSALGSNAIDGEGAGDGAPDGGLNFPPSRKESQIAIDESGGATDGNIYVVERPRDQVSIFNAEGTYLGELNEHPGGTFSEPLGVAVDPSGNVYVGDFSGADLVHKYEPAANPPVNGDHVAAFNSLAGASSPGVLAAGAGPSAGFIFVSRFNGELFKLDDTTGELKYQLTTDVSTVSVDPTTGHVFAAKGFGSSSTIDEYDASGAGSANLVSSFEPGSTAEGVAVNGAAEEVYVARSGFSNSNVEVYGPPKILPDVTTGSASSVTPTSATLNGTVNPDGEELTECFFEWGASAEYGETAPCAQTPAEIGSGTAPVAVDADLTGLHPGTVYHFRLVAVNPNATVSGANETFQTLGPAIAATWSEDVLRTEATLKAQINPEGKETTYRFEYGTTDEYGQETEELEVGSDSSLHEVSRHLSGLTPGTTYHYRAVATNEDTTNHGPDRTFTTYRTVQLDTGCPNQVFRYGPSAKLPDCRAYEMVSPLDKAGGDIIAPGVAGFNALTSGWYSSAPGGEKVTYTGRTSFGDQEDGRIANQYIATRGASGWSSHGINPPSGQKIFDPFLALGNFGVPYFGFTSDLSRAWVKDDNVVPLTADAREGFNLYRRDNLSDGYEALTRVDALETPSPFEFPFFIAYSDDGSRTFITQSSRLTLDAAENSNRQIYEVTGGEPELISVLPGGGADEANSNIGMRGFANSLELGSRLNNVDNAVSADGSRVFWTSQTGSSDPGKIYVRIVDGEATVPVSESVSAEPAQFLTADEEGKTALFRVIGGAESRNLYLFDVDSETATPIAGEVGGSGNDSGFAGAADDLSHLYFFSREDLDAGGPAVEGEENLYHYSEGAYEFIAATPGVGLGLYDNANIQPLFHAARVTPDGLHLAFMSTRSLTGYDNRDTATGEPATEVFLYDAATEELLCASCKPSGARPRAEEISLPFEALAPVFLGPLAAAWIPTWEWSQNELRPLSPDGNRLFFNARDPLVPGDTNGVQDVYQWEAPGTGGCDTAHHSYSPRNGGCIDLISTGQSTEKSEFMDATPDGSGIFFFTESGIHPEDPGLRDVYVANVGGGYPPPAPPSPCVGDACQPPVSPPEDPTPGSAATFGPGDPAPRGDCRAAARRAKKLSDRAKRARRNAKTLARNGKRRRAKGLHRRASGLAKRARRTSNRAKRCRRANRRAQR